MSSQFRLSSRLRRRLAVIAVLAVAILVAATYPGKTLWDLAQLVVIPLVVVSVGYWLNKEQQQRQQALADKNRKTDLEIARDREQETALESYLSQMATLLLHEGLVASEPGAEVRQVARALTFTTLRRLDGERKASVLRFLYQANLIRRYIPIIDLGGPNDYYGADLTKVELQGASLDGVYLCQVNLREADLSDALVIRADLRWSDMRSGQFRNAGLDASELDYARLNGAMLIDARLRGARLVNADLTNADLAGANLANADLRGANLTGANVTNEQLATAKSLAGAILPNGRKLPDDFKGPLPRSKPPDSSGTPFTTPPTAPSTPPSTAHAP